MRSWSEFASVKTLRTVMAAIVLLVAGLLLASLGGVADLSAQAPEPALPPTPMPYEPPLGPEGPFGVEGRPSPVPTPDTFQGETVGEGTGLLQEPYRSFLFAIGAHASVGEFTRPWGVTIGSDGTIYIADMFNGHIQAFSSSGTFLYRWGHPGSGEGEFFYPFAVAMSPDGTLYVADTWNYRIQRFSPTGRFLGTWGSRGSGDGEFDGPRGIAVAPDNTVYVADTNNHRIQRFSPTGQFLGKWGSWGNGDGQLVYPREVVVAPDGTVYVADTYNHRIQHFSPTGQFLGKWGSQGNGDGQFNEPRGVAVAPDGTVFVSDWGNHRIQRLTATGQFLGKWGSWGSEDGQFNHPSGIAVTPDGTVYVADTDNYRVQQFSSTGRFLGKWGSQSSGDGQMGCIFQECGPSGVAVAPDGTVYAADTSNHRIQRFSATGQFLGKWGSAGNGDGQFRWPMGVVVAPGGTVYVADFINHRVQYFSPTGQFLGKWDSEGSSDGQWYPRDVAVAPDETVYVAEEYVASAARSYRIQRFSPTGQSLGSWGSYGSDDGQFDGLAGVAVAHDGTLYVADRFNHRIQRFSSTGQFLGKWGSFGSGNGQFDQPAGVAVAPDGAVYVTDSGNDRIQHFSATGQFLGKWGFWGNSDGQFDYPYDVSVAPDNTLYVADYWNARIQVFGQGYPTSWRGEYFANRWLAERPALIRQESTLDFNWSTRSPGHSVPADNFSARWQRYAPFEEGLYRFTIFADDGVRLWVDDRLLIDAWQEQVATHHGDAFLSAGYHRLRVEYFDAGGSATLRLSWQLSTSDFHEPDNTCSRARWITVDDAPQSHMFHTESDEDWVKFTATAGTWYEIRTANLGSNGDTVLELYDSDCSTLIAADDDAGEGFASRIIWVPPANKTYFLKARPFSSYRTGANSNYELIVTTTIPWGVPLLVRKPDGSPATWARVEVYSDIARGYDFWTGTGLGGYVFLNLPNGSYVLVVSSEVDHFILVKPDLTVPAALTLRASEAATVDAYAYKLDRSPLSEETRFFFRPSRASDGSVGWADSAGHLTFNATDGRYNAFAWSWGDLYYLVQPNVTVSGPASLSLNAAAMATGQISASLQGITQTVLHPWGSYTTWAPIFTVDNGVSMVLSTDTYWLTGWLRKYTASGSRWSLYFEAPTPFNVTPGDVSTFYGGGSLSAATASQRPGYNPGQAVTIINDFRDAFGNRVTGAGIFTPTVTSALVEGEKAIVQRDDTAITLQSGEKRQKLTDPPERGMDLQSNSQRPLSEWTDIYPITTVRDPNGEVILRRNAWGTIDFTLPASAPLGLYRVETTLDTGPYEGILRADSSFQVKPFRVYLPAILKQRGSPLDCIDGFEAGHLEPCWQHGGELGQSVVDRLDTGGPAFPPHYSALLGQPELGPGLPGQSQIPAGSAWIQRRIQVPNTSQPRLTFQYRVISYDASVGSDGRLWDTFDAYIGEELVFRDDHGDARPPGSQGGRHDTGWRQAEVDLSRWRGQEVVLRFAVWNREYDGNGVDYYNTWAYLDRVEVQ